MALMVHQAFDLNGRRLRVGEPLFGADADMVAAHPDYARLCTAVPDEQFEHLRPPAVNTGFAPSLAAAEEVAVGVDPPAKAKA